MTREAVVPPAWTLEDAAPLLRRPFTPEAVNFRPVGGGSVVAYIDARCVVERLNHVIPGKWATSFEPFPGGKQIICHLTIDGVTRSDVGTQGGGAGIDPVKVGYSDALKRAAVHFGVGVSIYALKRVRLSDLPQNGTRTVGAKGSTVLTDEGEAWLRAGYRRWLEGPGKEAFGEALDHGDMEGAAGTLAEEGTPADAPVEAPPAEQTEAVAELEALYEKVCAPGSAGRKKFGPAKFKANLAAAEANPDALAKLREKIEGLAE